MKAQPTLDAASHMQKQIEALTNSHAALVAALEDAEFLMRQAAKHAGSMQDSFKRSAEDARAALALARGNQSNP